MSRRIVHRWVALLLARRCLGDDAAPAPDRPHVLVLLTDQQRRDSVSAFARATRGPDGAPLTPHLDLLVVEVAVRHAAARRKRLVREAQRVHGRGRRQAHRECERRVDLATVGCERAGRRVRL